jgi:hypothetical protein
MIGGGLGNKLSQETLASAATISPQSDLVTITGSTAIATIVPPPVGGFSQMIILVPSDGTLGLLTTGNIAVAVTMAQNRATLLVFSKSAGVWYPGAIS